MSLDVYIQPSFGWPLVGTEFEAVCSLTWGRGGDVDGYYWFLWPLFKDLAKQTGQLVDLYGDAFFCGEDLDALAQILVHAHGLVNVQPDIWEVHIGTQLQPVRRELYSTVNKQQMVVLLDRLEAAIHRAKNTEAYVSFIGD